MLAAKAMAAYTAITPLLDMEWDFQTAYEILQIKKELQEGAEFFAAGEMKIISKFADKNENGEVIFSADGKYNITGADNIKAYSEERAELGKVEVKYERDLLEVPITGLTGKIKPAMIEALSGVITFKGATA